MAKQTFTTGQVLTAAQMTSLQQTAMLGGAASAKTASYTLVAADAGTAISMSNAGATTITVNTSLFAAGDTVHITNLGAGVCTITAGTATVNSSASLALAQYESGFLDFTSTSAAIFVKGAGAAASSSGLSLISSSSFSASSGQSFNDVFTSTYTNYRIVAGITGSTTSDFRFRYRLSGTDNTTANFHYQRGTFSGSSATAARTVDTTFGLIGSNAGNRQAYSFDVFEPQAAQEKKALIYGSAGDGAGTLEANFYVVNNGLSTAFDGITIYPSTGTFTGRISIYGYAQ
jgi:hypothetical protein